MGALSLRDCHEYIKMRSILQDAASAPNEKEMAERKILLLEGEHPDIRHRSAWAERMLTCVVPPDFGDNPRPRNALPKGGWQDLLEQVFDRKASSVIEKGADVLAGAVTGQGRFEPLSKGEIVLKDHACGEGQVCVEIRLAKRDVRRRMDDILDELERALSRRA